MHPPQLEVLPISRRLTRGQPIYAYRVITTGFVSKFRSRPHLAMQQAPQARGRPVVLLATQPHEHAQNEKRIDAKRYNLENTVVTSAEGARAHTSVGLRYPVGRCLNSFRVKPAAQPCITRQRTPTMPTIGVSSVRRCQHYHLYRNRD